MHQERFQVVRVRYSSCYANRKFSNGCALYIDEPSIGLHQKDNDKLIKPSTFDLGNTLIVVEHDEDTMYAAIMLWISGGCGIHGGNVVCAAQLMKSIREASVTGQYLSGKKKLKYPQLVVSRMEGIWRLSALENNLKNINVKFLWEFLHVLPVFPEAVRVL